MLNFITDIFKGTGDKIAGVIDELHLSAEEKLKLQNRVQELNNQAAQTAATLAAAELSSRAEIIKAEMQSGDKWTSRARPMIIYSGLVMTFILYILLPTLAWLINKPMPELALPAEFWWAWGTAVSVYATGRSAEKLGIKSKLTSVITGN